MAVHAAARMLAGLASVPSHSGRQPDAGKRPMLLRQAGPPAGQGGGGGASARPALRLQHRHHRRQAARVAALAPAGAAGRTVPKQAWAACAAKPQ